MMVTTLQCHIVNQASTCLVYEINYYMAIIRYTGHKGSDYKIDSMLTHDDACVVSGSEDSKIYFWDLVEVTNEL